ncbi:hypothetical protein Sj15T_22100 [Sphingobium sp. TA15]|nr:MULTISPECIES: glycosyltransferase family 39 protein [Sphingobium]WDA38635.1 glycosyltransferase family 39 protein [Sphingobium sp. YC-XJ3]BDD67189.1 hypothetical protein Sj15T_22100 [Sphingobium sp. TA15]
MISSLSIDPASRDGRSKSFIQLMERHAGLLVMIATALLCLPFTRSIWLLADEGIWLHAAQRMIGGQALYRDFFEFHPPLGFLITAGWLSLFGQTLLAARLLMVLVIALIAGFGYSCCRMVSNRPGLSATLVLAWSVSVPGPWMQVNHHWFTSLFSMLTLWAILRAEGKPVRLTVAGLAACAATLVTTHRGGMIALAGLLSILSTRSVRSLAVYISSGLTLAVLALAYLWSQGTMLAAFDQVILYALNHYSNIQALPYGAFMDVQMIFGVLAFPLAAALLLLLMLRKGAAYLHQQPWPTLLLFAITGFGGCFPRPDAVHITFCAVLVLPLLAAVLGQLLPYGKSMLLWRTIGFIAIFMPLPSLTVAAVRSVSAPRVETRAGLYGVVTGDGILPLLKRLQTLPPGDTVFFYPADPLLPFLTGHHHAARLDMLLPQYSTPAQYQETCRQLMQGAQWVVSHVDITRPDFYRTVFPAMTDPSPHEKIAFEVALDKAFLRNGTYGGFQVMRRAAADVALCKDIAG